MNINITRRWIFFIKQLINFIKKKDEILVISGSITEVFILKKYGYENITITYYDENTKTNIEQEFKNINFIKLDLAKSNFDIKKYNYVIVCNTLHHLSKPHQTILNLYDIANKGLMIFEGNDSFVTRILSKMNLMETFENSAISKDGTGGLLNSNVANYIYRWTEREIVKLLYSYDPNHKNKLYFNYSYDLFNKEVQKKINFVFKFFSPILKIIAHIIFKTFPNQGNILITFIKKN
jgi:hypothetical protein